MEKENQPDQIQFVIVPDFILADENLSPSEKIFFSDIVSHTQEKGYCWGSNKYFENRYSVVRRTVTDWISSLEKKGFIKTEYLFVDGTKNVSERRIWINRENPVLKKYMEWYGNNLPSPVEKKIHPPIEKNLQDNNKQVNNKCLINLNIKNVSLNNEEYEKLVNEFGKEKVEAALHEYSVWKIQKNAHPKSDFDSLTNWIKKAANSKGSYNKPRMTAVKESGADILSEKDLDEISALI